MLQKKSTHQLIGKFAPTFKSKAVLPNGSTTNFNLEHYHGKNLVLYFYPMDNTPGCSCQARSFRDEFQRLKDAHITLIGVSSDSIKSHQSFQKKLDLPYTLISDINPKHNIAKLYDTAGFFINQRQTFLIDKKGIVFKNFKSIDVKHQVDDIIQAFQLHNKKS